MAGIFKIIFAIFFAVIALNPYTLRMMTLNMMHAAADATRHGWISTAEYTRALNGEKTSYHKEKHSKSSAKKNSTH